jgi:ferrous iron transport protein B
MVSPSERRATRVALLGNPNTGKTTLFNRLCGLRHKTSNYAGTTQEARLGRLRGNDADGADFDLIDLPGVYSLELDQGESEICRRVLAGELAPPGQTAAAPDVVCVVADGTNLARNFVLLGEALRRRLPTLLLINLADVVATRGMRISTDVLEARLGCPVVCVSGRTGEGCGQIALAMSRAMVSRTTPPGTQEGLEAWADELYRMSVRSDREKVSQSRMTDRLDRLFTHPLLGFLIFGATMTGLFYVIFRLAAYPMDALESVFALLATLVGDALPPGLINDCVTGGVIGGVGATLVFVPQICMLFFLISLLEDTGYLARAAFLMDRLLRPFGLPGHAFVPLLSSHACALPGIMAARGVPDLRDRLATILVAPFMSCSARIPVYALLTVILFPESPLQQSLAFAGCYVLGIVAGIGSAWAARRTFLKGKSRPMALELPAYRLPSLRTAFITTWDRALVFIRKAATNILAISIVLWWLSAFPKVDPPARATELRQAVEALADEDPAPALLAEEPGTLVADIRDEASRIENMNSMQNSFAAGLGRAIEPIFRPLGYDWRLCIGVVTSFAAREVFVSTMGVVAVGSDDSEDQRVTRQIASMTRDDGVTPVLTRPVSWSLLVYYVLAMQCLPTLAVTAREAGGTKWALLQLGWMCGLAYICALIVYQVAA